VPLWLRQDRAVIPAVVDIQAVAPRISLLVLAAHLISLRARPGDQAACRILLVRASTILPPMPAGPLFAADLLRG